MVSRTPIPSVPNEGLSEPRRRETDQRGEDLDAADGGARANVEQPGGGISPASSGRARDPLVIERKLSIYVRVTPAIRRDLDELVERTGRTLSSVVCDVLGDALGTSSDVHTLLAERRRRSTDGR